MGNHLKIFSILMVLAACCWCTWIGYKIWTTPVSYRVETIANVRAGTVIRHTTRTQQFSERSTFGPVPLLIPVVITLAAMWSMLRCRLKGLVAATVLLAIFWFVAGFSVGMAYTPAVVLLCLVSIVNLIADWRNGLPREHSN